MNAMIDPDTQVRETPAFEEMRAHILKLYDGVQVTHSYVIGSSHFDCVPENPAARGPVSCGITSPRRAAAGFHGPRVRRTPRRTAQAEATRTRRSIPLHR